MNVRTTTALAASSGPAYRLQLVFDAGPTMTMWRPLLRRLRQSLTQAGSFQSVSVSVLKADGTLRGSRIEDDRTVTLVVSDCSGPQWFSGQAAERWYGTLRRWARVRPVAVVQPLPERMWQRTAMPGTPGRICAPTPGAPNPALRFTPYDGAPQPVPDSIPVPVLESSTLWLENWFTLISGSGQADVPGAVAFLPPAHAVAPPEGAVSPADLSAEELVLRFRATASPEAFRLAGHLAVGVPCLPVMRLVQDAVEAEPCPSHLAEVILSGVLRAVPGAPGSYVFREGVGALLLRTVANGAFARTADLLMRSGTALADTAEGRFALVSEDGQRRLRRA
ncbi:SAV_2336 N-terminal domain-related protein [Streptomyces griseoincarnatus]